MKVIYQTTEYDLPLDKVLEGLTGAQSALLEDYLGGWNKFRSAEATTRSAVVLVWLAQYHAGQPTNLEVIESTPGLLFGPDSVFSLREDDTETPTEAADAASTQETSVATGTPPSTDSTD